MLDTYYGIRALNLYTYTCVYLVFSPLSGDYRRHQNCKKKLLRKVASKQLVRKVASKQLQRKVASKQLQAEVASRKLQTESCKGKLLAKCFKTKLAFHYWTSIGTTMHLASQLDKTPSKLLDNETTIRFLDNCRKLYLSLIHI